MENTKNIIWQLIIPIILLGIFVVLTNLLLIERQELTPESAPEAWYAGVGHQIPAELSLGEWTPAYGGGEGIDSVIARSDTSLRVSTGGDGGWYGARATVSDVNLASSSIGFSYRAHDWSELNRVMVLFSSNANFSDYYGFNLKNYFSNPPSGEWHDIILSPADFEMIEGVPSWDSITDIAIRVVPQPGVSTRVWFDEFITVPNTQETPLVTMTFDDGFLAVTEAAHILDAHDMDGTLYVIPEFLGNENYLTQDDVDQLAEMGWDISGHGMDNLTELVPADVDTQLAAMHTYLANKNYQGAQHFAYPNGAYNESVQSQVLEYFASARTIDGFQQPQGYLYPKNVNAITISNTTPITSIIEQIDKAVENNTWLIIVWHNFSPDPQGDVDYRLDDFDWVVQYLAENKIEVRTYSQAYDELTLTSVEEGK